MKRRIKKLEDTKDLKDNSKAGREKIKRVAEILDIYFFQRNKNNKMHTEYEVEKIMEEKGDIWVKEWDRIKNATVPEEWQEKINEAKALKKVEQ